MPDSSSPNVGYKVNPDGTVFGPQIDAADQATTQPIFFTSHGGVVLIIATVTGTVPAPPIGQVVFKIDGGATYTQPAYGRSGSFTVNWSVQLPKGPHALTVEALANAAITAADHFTASILEFPTGVISPYAGD